MAPVAAAVLALVGVLIAGLLLLDAGVGAGGWLAVLASLPLLTGVVPLCSLTLLATQPDR